MQKVTELVVSTASGREKYDEACKQTWKMKEVIAPVLKCAVKEYHDYQTTDIIRFINADSISETTPVDDLPPFIEGKDTEFSSMTENRVFLIFILQRRIRSCHLKIFRLCCISTLRFKMTINRRTPNIL